MLASPFGLEHLVLILLSWQALALCMEKKSLLLPGSILQQWAAHLAVPSAEKSLREVSTVHSELKFLFISLRCSYCDFLLQCHNLSACLSQSALSGAPDSPVGPALLSF